MGIFRSEKMVHKNIRIPIENAFDIMNELGKLEDCIEFADLNKDDYEAKKSYQGMISRCDELERKIKLIFQECLVHDVEMKKYETYEQFNRQLENLSNMTSGTFFDIIENKIEEDEKEIMGHLEYANSLENQIDSLTDKKHVYDLSSRLITTGDLPQNQSRPSVNSLDHSMESVVPTSLKLISGVINADDEMKMKRMIFRVSRGNAIATFYHIERDNSKTPKRIFTILCQSSIESNFLLNKLYKICDIFGATKYDIPPRNEIRGEVEKLNQEIEDKKKMLEETNKIIKEFLLVKSGEDDDEDLKENYAFYRLYFKKEKMIYVNLNKCKVRDNVIDGTVWIREDEFQKTRDQLINISSNNESRSTALFIDIDGEDTAIPPTFIHTNEFLAPFQQIVDTYGVPRYQEVNPTLFNIITFPFLFGVMFGDIGHGGLLLMFGTWMLFNSNDLLKLKSGDMLREIAKARYLFFLMGVFAFYCGWIYNDFFSMPLNLFGSCYINKDDIAVKGDKTCVYPIGLDPKWYVAKNELAYFNSVKMKISVILGVSQMIFGICLKGFNAIYFKNYIDFVFEFIPQIIFMTLLFGYLLIMIFIKWSIDWTIYDTKNAPGIINQLMLIFLRMGSTDGKPLFGADGVQEQLQLSILIICGLCIPIMLIPKPIILHSRAQEKIAERDQNRDQNNGNYQAFQDEEENHQAAHGKNEHSEGFGELFVHQAIETIEFVLGSISNTASYLRLWALSLAHAQLAKVFFEKCIMGGIHGGSILTITIGFFIFCNVTLGVLMAMDLMECFLHTLRLHWVEFQNKFYKADGYRFTPFCFKYITNEEEQ